MNPFDEDDFKKEEPKEPFSDEEEFDQEEDLSETPYDFRAEYKERITGTLPEPDEVEKNFSSIRFHAIGIGILIGVLIAILASAFFFGAKEDEDKAPVVITGNEEPIKERPAAPGGMEIPDQDKLVYKRMRTDDMDTKVERLFPKAEEPIVPVVEETPVVPTREGQILGAPVFVPENQEQMELEVLSLKEKGMKVEAPVAPVQKAEPPAVKPAPVVKSTPAPQKAATSSAQATPKPRAQNNVWRVQLISLPSKAGAQKAWPKILKDNSALLSGLPHDIVAAEIPGKGTFYRLRVGEFKDRAAAKSLCDKLKARKQDCSLTR